MAGSGPPRVARPETRHLGAEGSGALKSPGACPAWARAEQVPRQRVCPELEFGAITGYGGDCPGSGPGGLVTGPRLGAMCRALLQREEPGRQVTDGELFPPGGVEKA